MWLALKRPLLGTWPITQACALTGNGTGDPLVCSPQLNPLSHTSQGRLGQLLCKLLYSVETAVMVLAQDSQENVVRDGQSGGGVNVKVFERFLRYCINRSSTCVSVERTACTNNWQM